MLIGLSSLEWVFADELGWGFDDVIGCKCFDRPSTLATHRLSHTGEKPVSSYNVIPDQSFFYFSYDLRFILISSFPEQEETKVSQTLDFFIYFSVCSFLMA